MSDTKMLSIPAERAIDVTNCENEPIHIPGRIQSHGFLLAVNRETAIISYASGNCNEYTGIESKDILDKRLDEFLRTAGFDTGYIDVMHLVNPAPEAGFETINPILVKAGKQQFNLVIHPSGRFMLFEFESYTAFAGTDLQRLVGISLSRILEAKTVEQTLQFAARQVKEIIGYDRVMVYKFWPDDHGEVVAEEKNDDLEPFIGLHYPASDIPRQARELYKINLVRIIADVDSDPAALLVTDPRFAEEPLDLTHSTLRAVSPVHIQYLKNMGVKASFSISIVLRDKLWGLIACHNYSPRFIDYKARTSAKLIGEILSSSLEYREEQEKKEMNRNFELVLQKILSRAVKDWNIAASLVNHEYNILGLTNASGAILLFENQLYRLGQVPDSEQINDLIKWIRLSGQSTLFHTDNLSRILPAAGSYKDVGSGLLTCTLSMELNEHIFWFKPELKKTVHWAGKPEKEVEVNEKGEAVLSPRRSFALWSQEIEGVSSPWTNTEIGAVMKLREEIIHLINQKASHIRRLNEELQKAYDELDTFSFTISHDLKTPLATIKNYTEILLEDHPELDNEVKDILKKVVNNADRMNLLIREVLSYSRIDRQEMNYSDLNMADIIKTIVHDVRVAMNAQQTEVIIGETPPIRGDEIMIYQVFSNIIGNAVKYSLRTGRPRVEIRGVEKQGQILYTIKDNGIGIDMSYGNQVFVLFKRLENARKYDGTGVGLAIVKRILEKHKAQIWYESSPDGGTIFYLSFKNRPVL